MDGAGRALAIHELNNSLLGNHFISGTGWGADQTLPSNVPARIFPETVVYWSGGVGYAVWVDLQNNVRASRFLRDTETWEASQVLGVIAPGLSSAIELFSPHVALARNAVNAGALVVWLKTNLPTEVNYSRYVPGSGWQGAQVVPGFEDLPAQVAMANNGDAFLVGTVSAARFTNGSWGAVEIIGPLDADRDATRIEMSGAGNAVAVFLDSASNLVVNRFLVGSGWQGSQSIGRVDTAFTGRHFDVDMDEAGRFLVAWAGDAGPAFPPGSTRLRTYVGGGFSLALTPAVLPLQRNGDNQLANVAVTRFDYTGTVDLQRFDCPNKVICVFNRSQIPGTENTAELRFITNVNDPAPPGNFVVRVTGTGGGVTTEAFIEVQIQ